MDAYTILAKYYDVLMNDFNYAGYLNFIKQYLKGEGIDLCCGSGTMTISMSKLGHKTIGVDLSNDMLNTARNKARENFQNIIFIQSDVVDFLPPHKVDFVTCVCDGINYINQANTQKLINNVASYLKTNGYFIFDISSEYKLTKILENNVFCEDTDKATYIWSNTLKEDHLDMQISFFEKRQKDLYQRIEEDHRQYIHKNEEILSMLSNNFEVSMFDGVTYNDVKNDSRRIIFICKRK